jgi:hypothetical protein
MPFGQKAITTAADAFDPVTWRAIISLPLQVGRFIATADTGGGDVARAAEDAAIPAFLSSARRKFENIPLIAQIAFAAMEVRPINPLSQDALHAKCADVLVRLKATANVLEVNAYKLLLIEMAEAVARAACDGEEEPRNLMNGATAGWYGLYPAILDNTLRYNRGPRVSTAEKLAINALIDALDAGAMVAKWQIMGPTRQNVRVYG